jgi:type I restriction enzyme S subunit
MSEFCPDEDDLPEGWALSALADVVDINPPKPKPDALPAAAPVSFLPMAAVSEEGIVTDPQTRAFSEVRKGYTAFADGDVILAKITPCFENGKAALVGRLTNGLGFGSSEFHVLRSLGGLLPKFVFHYFHQPAFRQDAAESMSGTAGQARVTTDYMRGLSIPLPPLAEQRRIVEKVEALLAQVNAARARLAKVPAILKRFRQSILATACSGRLAGRTIRDEDPCADWQESTLGQLLREPLRNGHSARASMNGSGVRTLTLSAVTYGDFSAENTKLTIADPAKVSDLWLMPDDILIERSNTPDLVGTTRLYAGKRGFAIFPDLVIRARVRSNLILPRFVELCLCAPEGRTFFTDRAQGSSGTMPKIDQTIIESFPILLPPRPEQHEIVRRVDALFKLADAIEARVAAATARADKITQAILAKAFRGELVPTEAELARQRKDGGRDYEPASALLARIRAARTASEAAPKPARRLRVPAATPAPARAKPARQRTNGRTARSR